MGRKTGSFRSKSCRDIARVNVNFFAMDKRALTLGHSPDPDDAFMFYGMARGLVDMKGYSFQHILQDIQTLNERAQRGELDVTAISIHAYSHVCGQYALLPTGASMGDGYGPMVVAPKPYTREELARKRIAVPGLLTSAFLALQLWLGKRAEEFDFIVAPFDQIFDTVRSGKADAGLIIHEGQLTYAKEGLQLCVDLGIWWGQENQGLPLPLGGNVIHKRIPPAERKIIADIIMSSIAYGLDHRPAAVQHALQYARDMDKPLADRFVGMYVNHWTLDYGEKGRESIRRFLTRAHQMGLAPQAPELEFVV
jgi:1,4-dihydroxy-6-naphthoate synthase